MYEDNNYSYKVGINWKDILIKIVMLILFIILLLWLFPKPNLDVFYDNVYNNNINAMKDAARNYYTVDRLPNNVGEQTSMTLKEMFDNHLLIRFTDKDGAMCDETSSKVELSKIADNEYALKVQLNCGEQKDYILDTIGCTSVCTNGTCTTVITDNNNQLNNNNNTNNNNNSGNIAGNVDNNSGSNVEHYVPDKGEELLNQVTYYQHKKAVTTTKKVYTCPEGYTKEGTKCTQQTTGATIDATPVNEPDQTIIVDAKYVEEGSKEYVNAIKTKIKTEYTCPTGYTLNGSYCIKYTDAIEHTTDGTYTCPSGYTKNGTKCTKTYNATYVSGSTQYTCPSGGTLNGTKCTITESATATTTYTCPAGYTKNGTSCYKVYDATPNTSSTCPSGYTKSGSNCIKTYSATPNTSSTCPSGYTKSGSNCIKTYSATPNTTYSCPNGGTLKGTKCETSTSYNATANTVKGNWVVQGTRYYTSPSKAYTSDREMLEYVGQITGAKCGTPCGNSGIWYQYTYKTRSVTTNYTCPNGGTLSGTKCVKTSSYNATPKTSYTCPSGGTLSGTTCTLTTSANNNTTYTCPNGGTLNGTTCTLTTSPTNNTSYSCPNGGTLNGNKCTLTATATASTTYTCPAGYTKNGTTCTRTYDASRNTASGSYTCPDGGTLNGTKCTITKDATYMPGAITRTCPTGYTLVGDKCEYKISANAKDIYSYTCPAGYTAEGKDENTKCYKISTVTKYYCEDSTATLNGTKCTKVVPGGVKYYTCPQDYSLSGDKCTKRSTITIDANVEEETTTSYKYTWSKNSYLEGWTFTGKTKIVEENYVAGQK